MGIMVPRLSTTERRLFLNDDWIGYYFSQKVALRLRYWRNQNTGGRNSTENSLRPSFHKIRKVIMDLYLLLLKTGYQWQKKEKNGSKSLARCNFLWPGHPLSGAINNTLGSASQLHEYWVWWPPLSKGPFYGLEKALILQIYSNCRQLFSASSSRIVNGMAAEFRLFDVVAMGRPFSLFEQKMHLRRRPLRRSALARLCHSLNFVWLAFRTKDQHKKCVFILQTHSQDLS